MFKRCGAAMLLTPLGMLGLGLLLALIAPRFIAQRPEHHHREHGRERRLLEQRNNDAAVR